MASVYLFGFLVILRLACSKMYSVFECRGHKWNLTSNDNNESMQVFQDWLYAWQNGCQYHKIQLAHHERLNYGGMGCTLQYELKELITYVELNLIYRSNGVWQWAEHEEAKNCLMGLGSIDCFFKPISLAICKINCMPNVAI